jgi:hypothetical protein
MLPLAVALSLDFYLVMLAIAEGTWIPLVGAACFAFIVLFWFILPRADSLQRLMQGKPISKPPRT